MEEEIRAKFEGLENRIYRIEDQLKSMKPTVSFPIVCSGCGKPSTVPFKPRFPSKLYCRDCFQKIKEERENK